MNKGYRGAALLLVWIGTLAVSLLTADPLLGQQIAASTATAEGFEGLEYNPAAVAAGRSLGMGFSSIYSAAERYSFATLLSDSLRLDYRRDGTDEQLNLLCGLAFPRESAFRVG